MPKKSFFSRLGLGLGSGWGDGGMVIPMMNFEDTGGRNGGRSRNHERMIVIKILLLSYFLITLILKICKPYLQIWSPE